MTPEEEKALLERVNKIETENEKLSSQVSGAETLLQQHKTEMGEARKEIKEAIENTNSLAKKEELQKALDKLGEIEENVLKIDTAPGNRGKGGKVPESLEELQQTLIQQAKDNPVIDEAWKTLAEEERSILWNSKDELSKFFEEAAAVPKPVPGSLLEAATNKSGQEDQTKQRLRSVFQAVAKGSSHVPASRRAGATGFAGASSHGN